MTLTKDQRIGLGIALNEAQLLGFEIDPFEKMAAATFKVFTLPEYGAVPDDRRVQLLFYPVGRVSARYLKRSASGSPWQLVPFGIDELLTIVLELDQPAIQGWRFFDNDEALQALSEGGASLTWESGADDLDHSISLSPLGNHWSFDLAVWFDFIAVNTPTGLPIRLQSFIDDGKRWWDGLHGGDERTLGFGLIPGSPPSHGNLQCPACGAEIAIGKYTTVARCSGCGTVFRR